MTCPACGAATPEGARFCPACGHGLVSRPDERRVATVLFADLVGFTTFSESADPEHVKNLVDRCFERLAADVNSHGGEVDKIVGDAIVALFGAPVAHEDDAERAVRAGLQMQRTLAELRERHQVGAEMRVGVNTGEVLVGALRAGGDYTAMGDVVNTASRLQTAAKPGRVLVGAATHEATRNGIRYEAQGPLSVKGREPVEAWVALEPNAPAGRRGTRPRVDLFGRDSELAMLCTALRTSVERSRAHLALVVGEAGVGKTRLAREVGTVAREEHRATVLIGHCAPYGEANLWFPVAEALRNAATIEASDSADAVRSKAREAAAAARPADDEAELERVTEGLLYLMGYGSLTKGVDPTRAREDAVRSLFNFFEGLAEHQPVVLALSDLQWADDLVLDLVDRLLARLRALPFMLFATARPELVERWQPQPGRHSAVFVNLEPLDAAAAADLARVLLGEEATGGDVDTVVERSGGNPFFIEELATAMGEGDTGVEVRASGDGHLPGTLRGLIAARIDALEPAERATLEDCAVIGPGGSTALVTALACARKGAEPRLDALVVHDLLEIQRNEYVFKTELIREVAYSTLTKAERARRHSELSYILADRAAKTGRVEEVLEQLAYHYGAAAELIAELGTVEGIPPDLNEKALGFLDRAATRAAEQETWVVAKRLLKMALGVLGDDGEPSHRLELRLRLARARAELHDTGAARADLDAAVSLAEQRGDERALATATTILGTVERHDGSFPASVATLDQAVERWRELGDRAGLGDALRNQGMTDLLRGELDGAAKAISEALDCFRSIEDHRGEASALQNLAWIAFYRGELTEAEERLEESATLFADMKDFGGLGWALGLLAWVRYQQGNLDEAERIAGDVGREAAEIGNRWASGIMQVLLGNIALWRGRTGDALAQCQSALGVFGDLEDAWGQIQAMAPMSRALACLGRMGEASETVDTMSAVAGPVEDSAVRQFGPVLRANIACHTGSPGALAASEEIEDVLGGEGIEAEHAVVRAKATLQAGNAGGAVEILEDGRVHDPSWRGPGAAAKAALALAYAGSGRPDEALSLCAELDAQAVSYLDRFEAAMARGFALVQNDDRAGAEQALWRVQQIADRTDSLLDQAIARLARAWAWEAMERPDAPEARREARTHLEALGIEAPGWETLFRLAATGHG